MGSTYVVAAWLVIQVVETISPAFGLGDAVARYVILGLGVGLMPVLVLSWVFKWTPQGLKRDADIEVEAPISLQAARRLDRIVLVVLALALGFFAFDKFVFEPQREAVEAVRQQAEIEEAREAGRTEGLVESYGDKSIAVLPFRDMSPEGDQEYFSEGIAEELLNLLARESRLRVISRTSAFAFKGQALEVPEIARRLKVGHVLEGSVRKAGNMVRITAQLIEARSDTHLWSQTWDRELTNIFAIQEEIAAAVAESLQSVLLAPAGRPSGQRMNANEQEAYELVLKGRYLLNQASVDSYQRAVPLYERAIELAPDYAPAHAGVAKVLRQLMAIEAMRPELAAPRIEAALDRALKLDPNDPDALTTRGAMLGLGSPPSDIEAAREYWRQALSVNPSDGDAARWLGLSYKDVDSVRYLEYMERAYGVAPTNVLVSIWLANALCRFDRSDEALKVLHDWHALDPGNARPLGEAGDVYSQARQLDQALRSYYQAFRTAPDLVDRELDGLVWLLLDGLSLPTPELALQWVERHIANNPNRGLAFLQKAVILWAWGRQEEALRLVAEIEQAAERLPGWWLGMARLNLLVTGDFQRSREWWEAGGVSSAGPEFLETFVIVDYAFVLQQTGDRDRARELIDANLARIEEQIAAGVNKEEGWDLNFYAAVLHALRGDNLQALDCLRQDAADGGLSSVSALKVWPHFDNLRDDPDFQALIAEQDEINARWRERLEDEGLLLTPEEVLALKNFEFDPFVEVGLR